MVKRLWTSLSAPLWALVLVACQATSTPMPAPTSAPPATTITLPPTSTAIPCPIGRVDTGMGGGLTIRGVVRDDYGYTVPNAYVVLVVYGEKGGAGIGLFGKWGLYTDGTGSYSFDNVARLESGHYEIWFNGEHEYGTAYESSGYYILADEIRSDVHVLSVTVHAATGSVLSAAIRYEDVDGAIMGFYSPPFTHSEPGHVIELFRGTPDNVEYAIGAEYGTIAGETVEWSGLAGGTYYLSFSYRRLDGVSVRCNSPAFDIPRGGMNRLEYTIRNCPPWAAPVLQ